MPQNETTDDGLPSIAEVRGILKDYPPAKVTEPRPEYDRGVEEGKFLLSGELSLNKAAVRELRGLLARWLALDGDNDDVAALIRETREALGKSA